jgi:hypothetical protein
MKTADEILAEHGIKPPPGKFQRRLLHDLPELQRLPLARASASSLPARQHHEGWRRLVLQPLSVEGRRNVQGQWP